MVCGIYKIECQKTKKIYVGSSVDIHSRIMAHKRDLLKKRHHNPYLQNSYRKYGGWSNFSVSILEICLESELIDKENKHMKQYSDIFNLCEAQKGNRRQPKTYKIKNPSGVIIEITNVAKFSRENNLNSGLLNMVCLGTRRIHKGYESLCYIKKQRKNLIAFKLKDPNGNIHEGINVWKFCSDHQLCAKNIYKVISGDRPHAQGWTLA